MRFYESGITRPGIEPRSSEPLKTTLTIMPIGRYGSNRTVRFFLTRYYY